MVSRLVHVTRRCATVQRSPAPRHGSGDDSGAFADRGDGAGRDADRAGGAAADYSIESVCEMSFMHQIGLWRPFNKRVTLFI